MFFQIRYNSVYDWSKRAESYLSNAGKFYDSLNSRVLKNFALHNLVMLYIVIIRELFYTRALQREILFLWSQGNVLRTRTSGFLTFCCDIKNRSIYVQSHVHLIYRPFSDRSALILAEQITPLMYVR